MTDEKPSPGAGEKSAATPGISDPYAGLSNADLGYMLMDKNAARRRQTLILELEGRLPPKPNPATAVSTRATRLRAKAPDLSAAGHENAMGEEIDALRALFHDLLLHNAGGADFGEKFGLMIALRAQKQALTTVLALEKLQPAESIENRKNPRAKNQRTD